MRKYFQRTPVQTIMGHRLAEPRPTLMAVMWAMIYLGLPVLRLDSGVHRPLHRVVVLVQLSPSGLKTTGGKPK